jgi:glycosyltransferase involved in cell wall biosynthesis
MWPWLSTSLDRQLNRRLLVRQLTRLIATMPRPPIAITTVPVVADLIGELPVERWVYYCVDDFGEWPGLDGAALRRLEGPLVRRADRIIAVSEALREKLARMGRSAELLTHGVDLEFWSAGAGGELPPQLNGLERPLVVYWGVVDRRLDAGWVTRLAAELTRGTVVLVGPQDEPDPQLLAAPRVVHVPPVWFEQLPAIGHASAVLIMPYTDLPVTRAIQPLKLKEYLATGRPVVARELPSTRLWADSLDLADGAEAFSRAVQVRIRTGLTEEQRRARGRLAGESWREKARLFERWAIEPEQSLTSVREQRFAV